MTIWPRIRAGAFVALGLIGVVAAGATGCSEEEGASCGADNDCERGQICEDAVCTALECVRIGDCPGTGRTCLFDLRMCSAKECATAIDGIELTCSGARSYCIDGGSFGRTCVDPASLSCSGIADCAPLGAAFTCCQGLCTTECSAVGPDALLPLDMGTPDAQTDMGQVTDTGPIVDMDVPATASLCSACRGDGDCAELGAGARCTAIGASGSFCTSACGASGGTCPAGFQCVEGLDQCLPGIFECRGCLATPCGGGEVCDVFTGECKAPQGFCGTCADDDGCTNGLRCGPLGNFQRCFEPCPGGSCNTAGQICQDGFCKPESGMCDACGGACGGATPFCHAQSGQCRQCGAGAPCDGGLTCNLTTNTCTESGPGCQSDIDCSSPALPICFNGACIQCFDDSQCPPRNACNAAFTCEPAPCAGVECQRGSMCDNNTGRCAPGCNSVNDCVDPLTQGCDASTGQCYYQDGTCNLGGGEAVCAPGSQCVPDFFVSLQFPDRGVCTCVSSMPELPFVAPDDIIGCHNRDTCIYVTFPDQPVPANGTCYSLF